MFYKKILRDLLPCEITSFWDEHKILKIFDFSKYVVVFSLLLSFIGFRDHKNVKSNLE